MSTIVVIDDRQANREYLSSLLAYRGHRVVTANDGLQGLEAVRRESPALVICDILMPGIDGYEFVRRLRSDPQLAQTRVAFCSAYFHEHEAHQLAQRFDVQYVLATPCEPEQVFALIDQALAEPVPAGTDVAPMGDDVHRQHLSLMVNKLAASQEELEFANSALSALIDLNLNLAAERDPRMLLSKLCAGACRLFGAGRAAAFVYDSDDNSMAFYSEGGSDCVEPAEMRIGVHSHGELAKVQHSGVPLRLHDIGDRQPTIGLPDGFPCFDSCLAAAITSPERRYGWICLVNKPAGELFSEADEHLLAILAAQAGRIYENDCLYSRAQRHAAQLEAEISARIATQQRIEVQYAIARIFVESNDFAEACPRLLSTLLERLEFSLAALWEVDRRGGCLHCIDSRGRDEPELEQIRAVWRDASPRLGEDVAGRCWARNDPVWLCGNDAMASLSTGALVDAAGLKSAFAIPLALHGVPSGVIEFWSKDARSPSAELLDTFAAIGSQIAQSLERRDQQQQILRLNRIHAVLSGINAAIVRTHDRHLLFQQACRIALEQGGFVVAGISMLDPDSQALQMVASDGHEPAIAAQVMQQHLAEAGLASSVVALALRERKAVCSNDLLDDQRLDAQCYQTAMGSGCRSLIVLPLLVREQVAGAISLFAREPDFFNEGEIELLTELSDDVAFALTFIGTNEALSYLSRHDPLTALPNRGALLERLGRLIDKACRQRRMLAVVCFDIRRFRHINETFGRLAGDRVLCELAARLRRHWPDAANVARIGEDEFAAVLVDIENPAEVAHFFLNGVGDQGWGPFQIDDQSLIVTIRGGFALYPGDASDPGGLLETAEAALKNAKLTGAPYLYFQSEMTERIAASLHLEHRLRRALKQQEFQLHYQPKVEVVSGRVLGMEALLRWRDPEHGMVSPNAFVPVLEETGLILEVGQWVMQQALLDRAHLRQRLLRATRVAVNVSPLQLQQSDFVDLVRSAMAPHGGDGERAGLDLEITESLIMEQVEDNIAKLSALRALQVKTSIDDFGTGYSSLSYLARLPVDALKIDRSFIESMTQHKESALIVATTISLAHSLQLRVIAEGVELQQQFDLLRTLGCDEIQGYLISRPESLQVIGGWLVNNSN